MKTAFIFQFDCAFEDFRGVYAEVQTIANGDNLITHINAAQRRPRARSFDGRRSTITELSTGMRVADAKKSDAAETVARLLPAIKKAIRTEAAQKIAQALKAHAAKTA